MSEPAPGNPKFGSWDRLFIPTAIILTAAALLFPGDVPFINDEALLINNALTANERGELAPKGLMGTVGIQYGPVPTWLYQAALLATQDLATVSLLKNLIGIILLLAAMTGLARELGLTRLPPAP